jgi:aromatic-L-amino-acid decarboxylase
VALPDAGARLPARPRRRAAARRVRRHRPVPARRRRRRRRGQLLRPRVQLTRQFGALKLWLSLKVHGVDAFERAIAHGIGLAEHAERVLEADSRWEVVTPAQLAIVTFRLAGEASVVDERTRRLVAELAADGHAVISSTQVHGRIALRLCTDNPRTTVADVEATVARLGELAANSAVV